jgi:hypothetical protein
LALLRSIGGARLLEIGSGGLGATGMKEARIKLIIRQAIFNAFNTHGALAAGNRLYTALDFNQGNAMMEAVYIALRNAGVLKMSN